MSNIAHTFFLLSDLLLKASKTFDSKFNKMYEYRS